MKVSDKKYIFFDLDGTISDSMAGIIDSVEYTLAKYGIYEGTFLFQFVYQKMLLTFFSSLQVTNHVLLQDRLSYPTLVQHYN